MSSLSEKYLKEGRGASDKLMAIGAIAEVFMHIQVSCHSRKTVPSMSMACSLVVRDMQSLIFRTWVCEDDLSQNR